MSKIFVWNLYSEYEYGGKCIVIANTLKDAQKIALKQAEKENIAFIEEIKNNAPVDIYNEGEAFICGF